MGANLVRRLMRDGHDCVVFDVNPDAVATLAGEGATGAESLDDFVAKLDAAARGLGDGAGRRDHRDAPCTSSPAGWSRGDAIIDGGNSYYRDDIRRAARARRARDRLRRLRHQRRRLRPRARLLPDDRRPRRRGRRASTRSSRRSRPGVDSAERTPGRDGEPSHRRARLPALRPERRRPLREDGPQRHRVRADGRLRRGPEHPQATPTPASTSARPTPRPRRSTDPEYYQYEIDIPEVAEVWRRGSVVGSWLLDLTAAALQRVADARRVRAAASRTPARAAGPRSPRSRRACRRRC